jgi:hypothetical protein
LKSKTLNNLYALAFGVLLLCTESVALGAAVIAPPEVDRNAFWIESTVCSVVVKTPIDATKPLLAGNPIATLAGITANCTGNMMVQNEVQGGVRLLLQQGYRIRALSHQVTPLHSDAESKVDLLISAIFTLERPQTKLSKVQK